MTVLFPTSSVNAPTPPPETVATTARAVRRVRMSSATKSREIQIPIQSLRRGLFVSSVDRDWSETPFAFQGFLIEADHALDLAALYAG